MIKLLKCKDVHSKFPNSSQTCTQNPHRLKLYTLSPRSSRQRRRNVPRAVCTHATRSGRVNSTRIPQTLRGHTYPYDTIYSLGTATLTDKSSVYTGNIHRQTGEIVSNFTRPFSLCSLSQHASVYMLIMDITLNKRVSLRCGIGSFRFI